MRARPARTCLVKSRRCRAGRDANTERSHFSTTDFPRSYYNRRAGATKTGASRQIVEVRRSGNGQDLSVYELANRCVRANPQSRASWTASPATSRSSGARLSSIIEEEAGTNSPSCHLLGGPGRLPLACRTRDRGAGGRNSRSPHARPSEPRAQRPQADTQNDMRLAHRRGSLCLRA